MSFEVLIRQVGECRNADPIFSKAFCILPETELLKPVSDLLHHGSAPGLSGLTRPHRQCIPNGCSVGVEVGTCSQLGKVLAYKAE
jgi:hypothetical protein